MKLFFRYRKPSVKTMLGVTKAKRRLNKAIRIIAVRGHSALVTLAHQGTAAYRKDFDLLYRRKATHSNALW